METLGGRDRERNGWGNRYPELAETHVMESGSLPSSSLLQIAEESKN
jgi:hypothetical protein